MAQRIDEELQPDGFFERMWRKPIDDKRYVDYFAAVVKLERTATKICDRGASASNASLQLMEFDDAPPTACTETSFSGNLLDTPAPVKQAQQAYDLLRVAALSPEASLALVEPAAEDFSRCARTT